MRAAGRLALGLLLAAACRHPERAADPVEPPQELALGQESVPPGEPAAIEETTKMLVEFVAQRWTDNPPARRDAHVKPHGCVTATVRVEPGLPDELAVGLFALPAEYQAWIRFSNSSFDIQRDRKADGRGMAIKLMNVYGPKALPSEVDETSQDFILINYPVFVVRNALEYVEFTHDTLIGHPLEFFFHGSRKYRLPELASATHLALQKVVSPLRPTYYSMTPYAFGEGGAVKYGARPCAPKPSGGRRGFRKNYLREHLVTDLAEHGACFELLVQRQTDAWTMPIEDPTVEWSPLASPYRKVATIEIPAQEFDTAARREMCEALSFNPWHALPEHRPLGGINRVRKSVYHAISKLRHDLNGEVALEPTDWDVARYLAKVKAASSTGQAASD